ncbi:MAG: zinc metallopeptidase [Gammaproteobacteria bacterium]|nr:zinc metallopeptidase [Gammaproteobacteria bacterium]
MYAAIILIVLVVLIIGPQYWVSAVLNRYNRKPEQNFTGTGGELARHLLDRFELQSVKVDITSEGDHYDPIAKSVRLGEDRFYGQTLTAITIAAHEVGHAIQDARNENLFQWRSRLATLAVGAQKVGSLLLFLVPLLSIISRAPVVGLITLLAAFLVMGIALLVQLITLPVEIDASFHKALPMLESGYLLPEQYGPARKILRAAAFTYVAASLAGLLNFWRWIRVMKR